MARIDVTKVLISVVLIVGLSVGALRAWNDYKSKDLGAQLDPQGTTVSLISTRTKADWILNQSERFGSMNPGEVVSPHWMESREAMQQILNGQIKPVLWSPESPVWIARLNDVWKQRHGSDVIPMDDPASCPVVLESPMVFLTTREKAVFLRPLLAGPRPWSSLRDLSESKISAPWAKVRFSHADPINSNSGTLTLAMILNEYSLENGAGRTPDQIVNSPGFAAYLSQIESIMLYDKAAQDGTFALVTEYAAHPESRDFIVTHESAALQAATKDRDLVVIYPNPTAESQETIGILNAPWVTDQQKAIGKEFIASLSQQDALNSAVSARMRPAGDASEDTLDPVLDKMSKQGFQETFSSITLPSYDVLNTLAYLWQAKFHGTKS